VRSPTIADVPDCHLTETQKRVRKPIDDCDRSEVEIDLEATSDRRCGTERSSNTAEPRLRGWQERWMGAVAETPLRSVGLLQRRACHAGRNQARAHHRAVAAPGHCEAATASSRPLLLCGFVRQFRNLRLRRPSFGREHQSHSSLGPQPGLRATGRESSRVSWCDHVSSSAGLAPQAGKSRIASLLVGWSRNTRVLA
jgi:hypothetical protein